MSAQCHDLTEGEGRRWTGLGGVVRRMRLGAACGKSGTPNPNEFGADTELQTIRWTSGVGIGGAHQWRPGGQPRWRVGARRVGAGSRGGGGRRDYLPEVRWEKRGGERREER